ncbi:MAG: RNA methyltransferase [Bacteroidales bacterium]|nr:RNA methyltransferase [Bacteroidales bacterium]
MNKFEIIAKTYQGLEGVLAEEIRQLGAENVAIIRRAVRFDGDERLLYMSNIYLRTAIRILKPIYNSVLNKAEDLYDVVRQIDWSQYFTVYNTFYIDAVTYSKHFNNSHFVAQRTKDAIVDQYRDKYGQRPDIDLNNPHIRIHIHIVENNISIALDSSGESLHKRGYRKFQGKAPLNEVLAAGLIQLSGWDGKISFVDPMCGSGTLAIEAALLASGIPAGFFRKQFAFQNWKSYNRNLFDSIKNEINRQKSTDFPEIVASDVSLPAIESAKENAKTAGVLNRIQFNNIAFEHTKAYAKTGILIMNPPYGERLKVDKINDFYKLIGDTLKQNYAGYDAWIFSGNKQAIKAVGLRPDRKISLYNGSIEGWYYKYSMYSGKG